ncbi:MAG: glycosyltransferase [Candidatus Binatia bacterium]|nr:glycosyltransferase [Candidatus Binatia bacterium]
MRAALVSALYLPEFQGGATVVCRRLAAELVALGHGCTVFSGRTTADEPLGAVARGRVDAADTYRVNVGGALLPWARDGYWNPVATEAFAGFLAETRPDVVHVHSLQGLGAGVIGAARAAGAPVVVTMHDWWWLCPCLFRLSPEGEICPKHVRPKSCSGISEIDFTARRATLEAALSDVARIVVPSAFLRESLIENGFEGVRVVVHENGVPMPASVARAAGAGPGPTRFVFVGGAGNRAKGLDVLLTAAASLDEDFVLDAYSVDGSEAEKWSTALGARLRCHPPFSADQLDDVLSAADVVVVPSIMRESFSLVTREALARGRPVMTSDCGGPQEVVTDGQNGLVVPSNSVGALASALRRLAADREEVRALASRTSLEPVSVRAHAQASEALYREVVREAGGPRPSAARRRLAGRRVLFLTGMDGAPLRYRAWNLLERLALAGMQGDVLYHSDLRAVAAARAAELIVLYRAPFSATVARVVREARARAVPVLFSSDDFVFRADDLADAPALQHPDPQVVDGYRQSVEGHARCLDAADGFLGSTPELADGARDLGHPSYCLANGLSDHLLGLRSPVARGAADGPVRIGYASGTDTHDADLAMVAPALADVLGRFPQTVLALGGPVATPTVLEPFEGQIERWPFVPWNELPARLATLDVNLAPLDTSRPFNLGKSEVKLLEAAAVGVPTLASDAPAFVRGSRGGRVAVLCKDETEWRDGLARLVSEPALRQSLGDSARRDVRRRYGANGQVDDLVGILTEVFDRGSRGERPLPEPIVLEAGDGSEVAIEPGRSLFDQYQLEAESGGPLRPGAEVEQGFVCERDGLTRVDVRVGTYARTNSHDVHFSLQDEAGKTLAERSYPAEHFVDRRFVGLELDEPQPDSAGRTVTFRASAPGAQESNEILLWHAPSEMGGLTIGGQEQSGRALSFRAFAEPAGSGS